MNCYEINKILAARMKDNGQELQSDKLLDWLARHWGWQIDRLSVCLTGQLIKNLTRDSTDRLIYRVTGWLSSYPLNCRPDPANEPINKKHRQTFQKTYGLTNHNSWQADRLTDRQADRTFNQEFDCLRPVKSRRQTDKILNWRKYLTD